MTLFQAIVLGIVQGLTEFLPISSTGHLMLTAKLLRISQTEFMKSFEIAIQLGAILSVLFLYGRKFVQSRKIAKQLLVAFLPAGVIGLVFYKLIKKYL